MGTILEVGESLLWLFTTRMGWGAPKRDEHVIYEGNEV
jgi:hypothetical protein